MPTSVIKTGDYALFDIGSFSGIMFLGPLPPATMTGTSRSATEGKQHCVEGDEAQTVAQACPYIKQGHNVPGLGEMKIVQLDASQLSTKTVVDQKAYIIKGKRYQAQLTVTQPSQLVAPPKAPEPDPTATYDGEGTFKPIAPKCHFV